MAWDLKDYEPVEDRLRAFWEEYENGRIKTSRIATDDKAEFIFTAEIFRDIADKQPASTGWAQEFVGTSPVNKTSALENCETSAIGRALANLGYAAKGKRPSREEMQKSADVEPGPIPSTDGPEDRSQGAGKADAAGAADSRVGEVRGDAAPTSGESLAYGEGAGGSPDTSEEEQRKDFRAYLAQRYGTAQALMLARELFQTKARAVKNMTVLDLAELQAIDTEFKSRRTEVPA